MMKMCLMVLLLLVASLINPAVGQEISDEEFCYQESLELEIPEDEQEDYIAQCIESLVPQSVTTEVDHGE